MPDLLVEQICKYSKVFKAHSDLDQKAFAFLLKKKINPHHLYLDVPSSDDTFDYSLKLKSFFKATLIAHLGKFEDLGLNQKWKQLARQEREDSLLNQLYLFLTATILDADHSIALQIKQFDDGRLRLSKNGYWNLLKYPSLNQHVEAATLLILIGKITGQRKWIEMGLSAAKWHLQGLCSQYLPYRSFFSSYDGQTYCQMVAKLATLFHLSSLATEDTELAYISKVQFDYLKSQTENKLKTIPIELLLILRWIDRLFPQQLTPTEPNLDSEIVSESIPLLAKRGEHMDFFVTLGGCNQSMGSVKCDQLEIVAFGPQIGSLGNGKQFGSIPHYKTPNLPRVFTKEGKSTLEGIIGLPKVGTETPWQKVWQDAKSWLDVQLISEEDQLSIGVKPLKGCQSLSFVFYVIAEQCLIKGQKKFLNHSLDQYSGEPSSVAFLDRNQIITLEPQHTDGHMRVIPLEGENSFLGASYLIAYNMDNSYGQKSWVMKRSFR